MHMNDHCGTHTQNNTLWYTQNNNAVEAGARTGTEVGATTASRTQRCTLPHTVTKAAQDPAWAFAANSVAEAVTVMYMLLSVCEPLRTQTANPTGAEPPQPSASCQRMTAVQGAGQQIMCQQHAAGSAQQKHSQVAAGCASKQSGEGCRSDRKAGSDTCCAHLDQLIDLRGAGIDLDHPLGVEVAHRSAALEGNATGRRQRCD